MKFTNCKNSNSKKIKSIGKLNLFITYLIFYCAFNTCFAQFPIILEADEKKIVGIPKKVGNTIFVITLASDVENSFEINYLDNYSIRHRVSVLKTNPNLNLSLLKIDNFVDKVLSQEWDADYRFSQFDESFKTGLVITDGITKKMSGTTFNLVENRDKYYEVEDAFSNNKSLEVYTGQPCFSDYDDDRIFIGIITKISSSNKAFLVKTTEIISAFREELYNSDFHNVENFQFGEKKIIFTPFLTSNSRIVDGYTANLKKINVDQNNYLQIEIEFSGENLNWLSFYLNDYTYKNLNTVLVDTEGNSYLPSVYFKIDESNPKKGICTVSYNFQKSIPQEFLLLKLSSSRGFFIFRNFKVNTSLIPIQIPNVTSIHTVNSDDFRVQILGYKTVAKTLTIDYCITNLKQDIGISTEKNEFDNFDYRPYGYDDKGEFYRGDIISENTTKTAFDNFEFFVKGIPKFYQIIIRDFDFESNTLKYLNINTRFKAVEFSDLNIGKNPSKYLPKRNFIQEKNVNNFSFGLEKWNIINDNIEFNIYINTTLKSGRVHLPNSIFIYDLDGIKHEVNLITNGKRIFDDKIFIDIIKGIEKNVKFSIPIRNIKSSGGISSIKLPIMAGNEFKDIIIFPKSSKQEESVSYLLSKENNSNKFEVNKVIKIGNKIFINCTIINKLEDVPLVISDTNFEIYDNFGNKLKPSAYKLAGKPITETTNYLIKGLRTPFILEYNVEDESCTEISYFNFYVEFRYNVLNIKGENLKFSPN